MRYAEFLWKNYYNIAAIFVFFLTHAFLVQTSLFKHVAPMLIFCVIAYSAIQETEGVGSFVSLFLGIAYDTLSGIPLGITTTAMLFLIYVLKRNIDAIEDAGFISRYVFISLGIAAASGLQFALVCLASKTFLDPFAPIVQMLVTILFYPLVHTCLLIVQRRIYRRIWVFLPSEYKPIK